MSLLQEIVQQCMTRGIQLYVVGDTLKASPAHLVDSDLVSLLKKHKPDLIRHLTRPAHIPCQCQWVPECLGPDAPTELIQPTRYKFEAGDHQAAAVCAGCQAVLKRQARGAKQRQSKKFGIHRENHLLWAVLRTQRLIEQ